MDKLAVLRDYIKRYDHLPEQGTDEWLNDRKYTIGGSEIATIMSQNCYSSASELVARKLGLRKFRGNLYTKWGSLFEGCSESIITVYAGKIYSMGSIPHETLPHKYSPDGLCVLEIDGQKYIVLLEFKAPFKKIPNNSVPTNYIPQVKSGMCTINISEMCLFVNNMFRRCSLSQLNSEGYNNLLHGDKEHYEDCAFRGVIAFSIDIADIKQIALELQSDLIDEDAIVVESSKKGEKGGEQVQQQGEGEGEEYEMSILEEIAFGDKVIDLGEKHLIEEWLNLLDKYPIKKHFWRPTPENTEIIFTNNAGFSDQLKKKVPRINYEDTIKRFRKHCGSIGRKFIAVLPWKLIKSDMIFVEKENSYLDGLEDKMEMIVGAIKQIDKLESDEEKLDMFGSFYPDSKIYKDHVATKNIDYSEFLI
jgi:hypothetical protein